MVVHVLQKKSNHKFFSWMDVVFVTNVAQQKYPRVPYMDSIDFLTTKRIDGTWVMFVILDVLNVIHYSLSLCTYTIISFSISCYNIFVVLDVIQICYKHANIYLITYIVKCINDISSGIKKYDYRHLHKLTILILKDLNYKTCKHFILCT